MELTILKIIEIVLGFNYVNEKFRMDLKLSNELDLTLWDFDDERYDILIRSNCPITHADNLLDLVAEISEDPIAAKEKYCESKMVLKTDTAYISFGETESED